MDSIRPKGTAMSVGKAFERAHGKLPKNLQFTADGEELATRMELSDGERTYEAVRETLRKYHAEQVASGNMYRCQCGVALYDGEQAKHDYRRHNGPKPCKHYYRDFADRNKCMNCDQPIS